MAIHVGAAKRPHRLDQCAIIAIRIAAGENVAVVADFIVVIVQRGVERHELQLLARQIESPREVLDLVARPDDEALHRPGGQVDPHFLEPVGQRARRAVPEAVDHDVRLAAPRTERLQPGEEHSAGAAVGDNAMTAAAAREQAQAGDAAGQVVRPATAGPFQQPRRRFRGTDQRGVVAPEAAGFAGDVGENVRHGCLLSWRRRSRGV